MSDLELQLALSLELLRCSPQLRRYVHTLQAELARQRALNAPIDFELDGDGLSSLLRKQAG